MELQYKWVRAVATGFWVATITYGVDGLLGIILNVLCIAGLIFTWTYKLQPPRRIR